LDSDVATNDVGRFFSKDPKEDDPLVDETYQNKRQTVYFINICYLILNNKYFLNKDNEWDYKWNNLDLNIESSAG
jgi:hypothetical protein